MSDLAALMADLDAGSNPLGELDEDVRARLFAAVDAAPDVETWVDVQGIILNARTWRTVWQAVRAVDPTFPRTGRRTDERGNVLREWVRVPDRKLLLAAIAHGVRDR